VFTARYALSPYIKQICFVCKGLMTILSQLFALCGLMFPYLAHYARVRVVLHACTHYIFSHYLYSYERILRSQLHFYHLYPFFRMHYSSQKITSWQKCRNKYWQTKYWISPHVLNLGTAWWMASFVPGGTAPDSHRIESLVGPKLGVDAVRKKNVCLCRESNDDFPVV
jgi:hypothetical protein